MLKTTLHYILGTDNYAYLLYLLAFGLLGALCSLIWHYTTRDKSTNKPKFSIVFWLKDNWKRLILGFIFFLIALRFTESLTGLRQGGFSAFIVGFFNDRISGWIQNKGIIIGKRRDH